MPAETKPIDCPDDVAALLARITRAPQEEFWVLALDARHRPIVRRMVARGTLNRCEVHPRDIFRVAIRANAAAVIVVHNHPSGDPTPSDDDRELTRRLVTAGIVVGIQVLDHVILGRGKHYSFSGAGQMPAVAVRAAA